MRNIVKSKTRRSGEKGFTLMELVIVMGIFVVIGTIIITILSSTFQGNTKARVSTDITQNGNYVLNILSNLILNSQKFQSITDLSSVVTTTCSPTGTTGKTITVLDFEGSTTTLTCNDGASSTYTISSNSASLLDTSQVKLVQNSCLFTCTQADIYSLPRIDITFQLHNAAGTIPEKQATSTFSNSFSIRNTDFK